MLAGTPAWLAADRDGRGAELPRQRSRAGAPGRATPREEGLGTKRDPSPVGGAPSPMTSEERKEGRPREAPPRLQTPLGSPVRATLQTRSPAPPPRPPPLLPTSHSHTPPGSQDTTCPRLAWGVDTAFPPEQHPTLFHAQRSQEGNRGMESLPKTTACQWVRTGLTTQAGHLELCLQVRLPSPGQGPVPPQSTSAPLCRVGQHQPPWLETMTRCGGPGWPRPGAALSLTPEPSEQ